MGGRLFIGARKVQALAISFRPCAGNAGYSTIAGRRPGFGAVSWQMFVARSERRRRSSSDSTPSYAVLAQLRCGTTLCAGRIPAQPLSVPEMRTT